MAFETKISILQKQIIDIGMTDEYFYIAKGFLVEWGNICTQLYLKTKYLTTSMQCSFYSNVMMSPDYACNSA